MDLEIGDVDDALYNSDVNEVPCTNLICGKRINSVGWEWSVGRLGNGPIGASDAAHNPEMFSGPYATPAIVQSPHRGHKTREEDPAS